MPEPADNNRVEAALAARLKFLCDKHGQSEIARKSGTSRQNINRYLRGAKAPLSFGVGLATGLGVNPAWLLTGEGTTYLADVSESGAVTASHLTEVVKGMSAVSRMKLGELAGKHRRQVLRELGEALTVFEKHRSNLNAQVGGLLEALIDDMFAAIGAGRIARAQEIERTAVQLARFSQADDLMIGLEQAQSTLANLQGNWARSLELYRRVFLRNFIRDPLAATAFTFNFALNLHNFGFALESRRVANAALALFEGMDGGDDARHALMLAAANVDIELGDLEQALARLSLGLLRVKPQYAAPGAGYLARAQLLYGARKISDFKAGAPPDPTSGNALLGFGIWLEDVAELARVLAEFVEAPQSRVSRDSPRAAQARRIVELSRSSPSRRRQEAWRLIDSARPPDKAPEIRFFALAVDRCQLAWLAGDESRAAELLFDADGQLAKVPRNVLPHLFSRAVFYRAALRILKPDSRAEAARDLRARARAFFDFHQARGYRALDA